MGEFLAYEMLPVILNMTLTGSIVIALVLLARLALRRAPRVCSYALWLVVLFRLLCPVTISAPVSLMGLLDMPVTEVTAHTSAAAYVPRDVVHDSTPNIELPVPGVGEVVTDALPQGEEQTVANPLEAPVTIGTIVWLTGATAMLIYGEVSLIRLRRRLVGAVPMEKGVYMADHIDIPFVLGLFRPKIYLPSALPEGEQDYILLHERHHIRRLDHAVKLLAFLALCVHWFNPLVWLSFVLLGRDMEMSCDEAVMKKLGEDIRANYSASLLRLATGRKVFAGAPLAFGEGDTQDRVKNVLRWKEPKLWLMVLSVAIVVILAVVCGTNADSKSTVQTKATENGMAVTLTLKEPVRSYAVYEEIYQDGRLFSGKPVLISGFSEDNWDAMTYRHTFTLRTEAERLPSGGFSGKLDIWCEENSAVSHRALLLPGTAYTGMGRVLGTGNHGGTLSEETHRLRAGDSAVLSTLVFSTEANGSICAYHNGWSLAKVNDTVIQYRLVTSSEPAEIYQDMPLDLAQTLYDLRVEALTPENALTSVQELLDAMGASGCGDYELQYYDLSEEPQFLTALHTGAYWPGGTSTFPPYAKTGLVIWYEEISDEIAFRAMQNAVPDLLLALVPKLSEVQIGCAGSDGTAGYAGSSDENTAYVRELLGYESFEEAGGSAAGIRALMELLEWPENGTGRDRTVFLTESTPFAPVKAEWYSNHDAREVTTADIAEMVASRTLSDGTEVLFYLSTSGDKYCAYIPAGTERLIRFTHESNAYTEGYGISIYENVLGTSGFRIECPRGAAYYANDYYYFDEDGTLWKLVGCGSEALEVDLNGDGEKELLWSYHGYELYYDTKIGGRLYEADLCTLTAQALGYQRGNDVQVALEIPARTEDFVDGETGYTLILSAADDSVESHLKGTIRLTTDTLEAIPNYFVYQH